MPKQTIPDKLSYTAVMDSTHIWEPNIQVEVSWGFLLYPFFFAYRCSSFIISFTVSFFWKRPCTNFFPFWWHQSYYIRPYYNDLIEHMFSSKTLYIDTATLSGAGILASEDTDQGEHSFAHHTFGYILSLSPHSCTCSFMVRWRRVYSKAPSPLRTLNWNFPLSFPQ